MNKGELQEKIHKSTQKEGYKTGTVIEFTNLYNDAKPQKVSQQKQNTQKDISQTTQQAKPASKSSPKKRKPLDDFLDAPSKEFSSQTQQHSKKHFHQQRPKQINSKQTLLKKAGITLGGVLLGGFLLYQTGRMFHTNKQTNKVQEQTTLPQGIIAKAIHDDKTFFFSAKDSLLRDLCAKKAYVHLDDLTVNEDTLHLTTDIISQLSFDQLLQAGNLHGMYTIYTKPTTTTTDFSSALRFMWTKKLLKMHGRFTPLVNKWVNEYDEKTTPKTDVVTLQKELHKELEGMLASFDKEKFYHLNDSALTKKGWKSLAFHKEKQRFFNDYLSHLNEKTLLAYALTELFPDTNPALNIGFLDKQLQEAGEEFVDKIPAIHDKYLSFGLFQLTSKIITPKGAPSLNKYFSKQYQIPQSMKYINTPKEHDDAAIMTILYNANILANKLYKKDEISAFNDYFERLPEEKQELLIAGYASAAHHFSTKAASTIETYTAQAKKEKKDFDTIITDINFGRGLQNYYEQSIRNYLTLKAMDAKKTGMHFWKKK